jgi:predicted XRE-type DNA-binding protein
MATSRNESQKGAAGELEEGSIFDDRDLFGPDRGANLKVRARLMDRLNAYVEEEGLTQEQAAGRFDVGQPRVSYLMNGRISKFTIDALLNMCTAAGIEVQVSFPGAGVAGARAA